MEEAKRHMDLCVEHWKDLNILYLVYGTKRTDTLKKTNDSNYCVTLVPAAVLEATKTSLSSTTAVRIYAIQVDPIQVSPTLSFVRTVDERDWYTAIRIMPGPQWQMVMLPLQCTLKNGLPLQSNLLAYHSLS